MTTHPLNNREVLVIEVPETATEFSIMDYDGVELMYSVANFIQCVNLPPGEWVILLDSKEAGEREFQKEMMWLELAGTIGWYDYEKDYIGFGCKTATDSFHSWLRAKGYDPSKRFILLNKVKQ